MPNISGVPFLPHTNAPTRFRAVPGRKKYSIGNMPWIYTPRSTWVHSWRYYAPDLLLQVKFKDKRGRITARCQYLNIAPNVAANMRRVASAGKFVHRWLYKLPYTLF